MFDVKELESLDERYFSVIYKDLYDITIRSKNTGHFWSLPLSVNGWDFRDA